MYSVLNSEAIIKILKKYCLDLKDIFGYKIEVEDDYIYGISKILEFNNEKFPIILVKYPILSKKLCIKITNKIFS